MIISETRYPVETALNVHAFHLDLRLPFLHELGLLRLGNHASYLHEGSAEI